MFEGNSFSSWPALALTTCPTSNTASQLDNSSLPEGLFFELEFVTESLLFARQKISSLCCLTAAPKKVIQRAQIPKNVVLGVAVYVHLAFVFPPTNQAFSNCQAKPKVNAMSPWSYAWPRSPTSASLHAISATGAGKCFPARP
jgi:hypothetical protein